MSIQFDIAKQIIAETCPNRKLKLENIRLFADIIQPKKYQKGDIILNEGDICNCLFYIEKHRSIATSQHRSTAVSFPEKR